MNVGNILTLDSIMLSLNAKDYAAALLHVSTHLSYVTELRPQTLLDALLERESKGSTGLGRGIALPHARIAGISQIYGVFVRLSPALDVNAADGMPADIVFVVIAPESASATYLRLIGKIAQIFKSDTKLMQLRNSSDKETIFALLTSEDA